MYLLVVIRAGAAEIVPERARSSCSRPFFYGSTPEIGIPAGLAVIATAPVSGALIFRKARISIADVSSDIPTKKGPV